MNVEVIDLTLESDSLELSEEEEQEEIESEDEIVIKVLVYEDFDDKTLDHDYKNHHTSTPCTEIVQDNEIVSSRNDDHEKVVRCTDNVQNDTMVSSDTDQVQDKCSAAMDFLCLEREHDKLQENLNDDLLEVTNSSHACKSLRKSERVFRKRKSTASQTETERDECSPKESRKLRKRESKLVTDGECLSGKPKYFYGCGCGYTSLFPNDLEDHFNTCALPPNCIHCNFRTKKFPYLLQHLGRHLHQYDSLYTCPVSNCDFGTNIACKLYEHISIDDHAVSICSKCLGIFPDLDKLIEHHQENQILCVWCKKCNAISCSKEVMMNHLKSVHRNPSLWTMTVLLCKERTKHGYTNTHCSVGRHHAIPDPRSERMTVIRSKGRKDDVQVLNTSGRRLRVNSVPNSSLTLRTQTVDEDRDETSDSLIQPEDSKAENSEIKTRGTVRKRSALKRKHPQNCRNRKLCESASIRISRKHEPTDKDDSSRVHLESEIKNVYRQDKTSPEFRDHKHCVSETQKSIKTNIIDSSESKWVSETHSHQKKSISEEKETNGKKPHGQEYADTRNRMQNKNDICNSLKNSCQDSGVNDHKVLDISNEPETENSDRHGSSKRVLKKPFHKRQPDSQDLSPEPSDLHKEQAGQTATDSSYFKEVFTYDNSEVVRVNDEICTSEGSSSIESKEVTKKTHHLHLSNLDLDQEPPVLQRELTLSPEKDCSALENVRRSSTPVREGSMGNTLFKELFHKVKPATWIYSSEPPHLQKESSDLIKEGVCSSGENVLNSSSNRERTTTTDATRGQPGRSMKKRSQSELQPKKAKICLTTFKNVLNSSSSFEKKSIWTNDDSRKTFGVKKTTNSTLSPRLPKVQRNPACSSVKDIPIASPEVKRNEECSSWKDNPVALLEVKMKRECSSGKDNPVAPPEVQRNQESSSGKDNPIAPPEVQSNPACSSGKDNPIAPPEVQRNQESSSGKDNPIAPPEVQRNQECSSGKDNPVAPPEVQRKQECSSGKDNPVAPPEVQRKQECSSGKDNPVALLEVQMKRECSSGKDIPVAPPEVQRNEECSSGKDIPVTPPEVQMNRECSSGKDNPIAPPEVQRKRECSPRKDNPVAPPEVQSNPACSSGKDNPVAPPEVQSNPECSSGKDNPVAPSEVQRNEEWSSGKDIPVTPPEVQMKRECSSGKENPIAPPEVQRNQECSPRKDNPVAPSEVQRNEECSSGKDILVTPPEVQMNRECSSGKDNPIAPPEVQRKRECSPRKNNPVAPPEVQSNPACSSGKDNPVAPPEVQSNPACSSGKDNPVAPPEVQMKRECSSGKDILVAPPEVQRNEECSSGKDIPVTPPEVQMKRECSSGKDNPIAPPEVQRKRECSPRKDNPVAPPEVQSNPACSSGKDNPVAPPEVQMKRECSSGKDIPVTPPEVKRNEECSSGKDIPVTPKVQRPQECSSGKNIPVAPPEVQRKQECSPGEDNPVTKKPNQKENVDLSSSKLPPLICSSKVIPSSTSVLEGLLNINVIKPNLVTKTLDSAFPSSKIVPCSRSEVASKESNTEPCLSASGPSQPWVEILSSSQETVPSVTNQGDSGKFKSKMEPGKMVGSDVSAASCSLSENTPKKPQIESDVECLKLAYDISLVEDLKSKKQPLNTNPGLSLSCRSVQIQNKSNTMVRKQGRPQKQPIDSLIEDLKSKKPPFSTNPVPKGQKSCTSKQRRSQKIPISSSLSTPCTSDMMPKKMQEKTTSSQKKSSLQASLSRKDVTEGTSTDKMLQEGTLVRRNTSVSEKIVTTFIGSLFSKPSTSEVHNAMPKKASSDQRSSPSTGIASTTMTTCSVNHNGPNRDQTTTLSSTSTKPVSHENIKDSLVPSSVCSLLPPSKSPISDDLRPVFKSKTMSSSFTRVIIPDGNIYPKAVKCFKCPFSSMMKKNLERHIRSCHPMSEVIIGPPVSSTTSSYLMENVGEFLDVELVWLYENHEDFYVCVICKTGLSSKFILHAHLLDHLQVSLGRCLVCATEGCKLSAHHSNTVWKSPDKVVHEIQVWLLANLGTVEVLVQKQKCIVELNEGKRPKLSGVNVDGQKKSSLKAPKINANMQDVFRPCLGTETLSRQLQVLMKKDDKAVCDVCGACFGSTYSIHRHILTKHLNYYLFTCNVCGFGSTERYDGAWHMRTKHPLMPLCLLYHPPDCIDLLVWK